MKKKEDCVIELKDVWKIYQLGKVSVEAVRGVNFKVFRNEFVAVMGPSGSGKSTCMNLIGCLDLPTRGEIYLESINIATLMESDLAQIRGKKIGFVFQQFNLIPTLTALENVMLPMAFQNVPYIKRLNMAKELLALVGLKDRMLHHPNELSGGQQQRVAIARALANNPEVILADEPTGNVDTTTGKMIMDYFVRLNKKQQKTIVLVTHDPNIAKYANRIVHIRDGKIIGGDAR